MNVLLDADVQAVMEFMQEKVEAGRLVGVSRGIAALAPLLWGQYQPETVDPLRLAEPSISGCDPPTQPSSSG